MSKETKPKRARSTKKVSEESPHTAELEAKIADLEAKLANLSSQVTTTETKPSEAPKPAPAPRPRPAATGPTHGTLPAGMKPAASPSTQEEEYRPQTYSAPEPGEVAPAYAQVSSTGYTGNKYYATRARLSYHPPNKQFKGQVATTTTSYAEPPAPAPKPQRGTLPAGTKPAEQHQASEQEKKSMWKAKGSEYENYVPEEETHKSPPPPPPQPKAQRGTLPAGFKPTTPPPAQREEPKPAPAPEPAKPRPTSSGPTHGTLPAGMKPTPPPAPKVESYSAPEPGEVAPAYSQLSSSGYTGNKYYATRRRLSYHPPNKQFTGSTSAGTTTSAPPAPEPPKLHMRKGTLPAGFKP